MSTVATGVLAGGTAHYLQENEPCTFAEIMKVDATLVKAQTISDECMGTTADVMDETKLIGYDEDGLADRCVDQWSF